MAERKEDKCTIGHKTSTTNLVYGYCLKLIIQNKPAG